MKKRVAVSSTTAVQKRVIGRQLKLVADILAKTTNTLESLVGRVAILSWRLDRIEESGKRKKAARGAE